MSKSNSPFRFKQFAVSHHRSSMKVGVDGVLIGCWAETDGAKRILDVGTGCGLIALIMAQRATGAIIDAIDIDAPSVDEASENFEASAWRKRLRALRLSFQEAESLADKDDCYDLIVSNPPYFDSGVTETVTAREKARHQGELSPSVLLDGARRLLRPQGRVALVVPADISGELEENAAGLGYRLERKCLVRGHLTAPYKRVLIQWILTDSQHKESKPETEFLTLELSPGVPTEDYRRLCKDFYLRF